MQWTAEYIARGSMYIRRLNKTCGPAHKVNKLSGHYESSSQSCDGKNEKTCISKDRWYSNLKS